MIQEMARPVRWLKFAGRCLRTAVVVALSVAAIVTAVIAVRPELQLPASPPGSPMSVRQAQVNGSNWSLWLLAVRLPSRNSAAIAERAGVGLGFLWVTDDSEAWSAINQDIGPLRLTVTPQTGKFATTFGQSPTLVSPEHVAVTLFVADWMIPFLFALYPLWAFVRGPWRRRRRKAKGLCVRCGYDLTGNVTGVCSECGSSKG